MQRRRRGRRPPCSGRSREHPFLEDALAHARTERGKRARSGEAGDPARAPEGTWHPRAASRLCRPRTGAGVCSLAAKDQALARKWLRRFVDLISVAPVPAVREATGMEDPVLYLQSLVGRARPSTVRLRVRDWAKYVRWLTLRTGSWPQCPRDVVEYLWAQVRENPAKTFPGRFLGTLAWFEKRSGLPEGQRWHFHDAVKRCFEKVMVDLDEAGLGRKRAPRFPLVLLCALEGMVLDSSALPVLRVVAWTRLLKVYGVLRADDLQRLAPENARLQDGGFVGNLTRTKTSGAGKKVKDLLVFVPRSAWVAFEGWLEEGYILWRRLAPWPRDHFLPRAEVGLELFVPKLAEVADVAAVNTKVLECLLVVQRVQGPEGEAHFERGSEFLLPPELAVAWTGHSERTTLPSALAAIGVPKQERDPLGRWSPGGSEDYVRTYRAVVKRLVGKFVLAARGPAAFDDLDEADAIDDMQRVAVLRGGEEAVQGEDVARLLELSRKLFGRKETENLEFKVVEEYVSECLELQMGGGSVPEEALASSVSTSSAPNLARPADRLEEKDDSDVELDAKFVIASTDRGRIRTIHRVQGCWRASSLAFTEFELVAEVAPQPGSFDRYCRICWPRDEPPFMFTDPDEFVEEDNTGPGSSSVSGSSTEQGD